MSGIMSGHVGAMKKKGGAPLVVMENGGLHITTKFMNKDYVVATKAFGEVNGITWGSNGTTRGTTSTTNGKANSNTLYSLGQAAHPAAYFCRSRNGGTGGSYTDWYLPAKDELNHMYSAKTYIATNFTVDAYADNWFWSSTEYNGTNAWIQYLQAGYQDGAGNYQKSRSDFAVRAVRSYP